MDMMQSIIKREFEKASGLEVLNVVFTEDEQILVKTPGRTSMTQTQWTMEIGSDDDEFVFTAPKVQLDVRFPFPPDWDEAIDENNFS